MKTFSYSTIGESHIGSPFPCQDASIILTKGNTIIGVWADGAGSAKYSDIASQLVVDTASRELSYLFSWRTFLNLNKEKEPWSSSKARRIFNKVATKSLYNLTKLSKQKNIPIEEYHTTLGAFILTPYWLASFQIGDGFLVTRNKGDDRYNLTLSQQKGEYANTTYFLRVNSIGDPLRESPYFQVATIPKPVEFVCASTDGLDTIALKRGTAFKGFFSGLEENFIEDSSECTNIKTWLAVDKQLNLRTQDDKTLVIASTNVG